MAKTAKTPASKPVKRKWASSKETGAIYVFQFRERGTREKWQFSAVYDRYYDEESAQEQLTWTNRMSSDLEYRIVKYLPADMVKGGGK